MAFETLTGQLSVVITLAFGTLLIVLYPVIKRKINILLGLVW